MILLNSGKSYLVMLSAGSPPKGGVTSVYLSGYTLGNLSGNNTGSSNIFAAKYDEKGALLPK